MPPLYVMFIPVTAKKCVTVWLENCRDVCYNVEIDIQITQVSQALDAMGCTRVVIAHRLSTIRNCDRILMLDGGTIVEDGSYDALIEKGGFFADLVARQRVDAET